MITFHYRPIHFNYATVKKSHKRKRISGYKTMQTFFYIEDSSKLVTKKIRIRQGNPILRSNRFSREIEQHGYYVVFLSDLRILIGQQMFITRL
jgi:hypothetical protein